MRAMRRERISSAAMREASSTCSHVVADGAAGKGFGGRSGRSRKARFSCMAALLALHRLDGSVVESVNDLAQVEQIAEPAEIVGTTSIVRRRSPCLLGVSNRYSWPESASGYRLARPRERGGRRAAGCR